MNETYFFRGHDVPIDYLKPTLMSPASEGLQRMRESWGLLRWARIDYANGSADDRGLMNAIGHAKRALDPITESLMELFGLRARLPRRATLPERLRRLDAAGALPASLAANLIRIRNSAEHERTVPTSEQVHLAIDSVYLMLLAAGALRGRIATESVVGWRATAQHMVLRLDRGTGTLTLHEFESPDEYAVENGTSYYSGYLRYPSGGELAEGVRVAEADTAIPIDRDHEPEWAPILGAIIDVRGGFVDAVRQDRVVEPDVRMTDWRVDIASNYLLDADEVSAAVELGGDEWMERMWRDEVFEPHITFSPKLGVGGTDFEIEPLFHIDDINPRTLEEE